MLNAAYMLELPEEGVFKKYYFVSESPLDQLQQNCKMGSAQAVVCISKAFGQFLTGSKV